MDANLIYSPSHVKPILDGNLPCAKLSCMAEEKTKTVDVHCRISAEHLERIDKLARQGMRSRNNLVALLIREALQAREENGELANADVPSLRKAR